MATAESWPRSTRFARAGRGEAVVACCRCCPSTPDDLDAATQVEEWLRDYATSRDPQLRERIILAYLGLADRLASRYRRSRGVTPKDLTQTARVGLIAAVDRYLRDTSWRLHVPSPRKE